MTVTSFPESINIDVEAVQILCTESENHFNLALSKMADFNAVEQRTIIKMCATLGKSPVDTMKKYYQMLQESHPCAELLFTSGIEDFQLAEHRQKRTKDTVGQE